MKRIRIIALIFAFVIILSAFASCGNSSPKVEVNCTISVVVDGEYILDHYAYKVSGTEETPPTVLKAADEALLTVKIPHEIDSDYYSFVSISNGEVEYRTGLDTEGKNICVWMYTANGEEPRNGRAGTNPVLEGQDIVFTFIREPLSE